MLLLCWYSHSVIRLLFNAFSSVFGELDQPLPENLYLVFFLFVLQSAVSYFFAAYKQTFVNANQKTYQLGKIEVVYTFISCLVDIVVLLVFRNFIAYLLLKL